jgi:excisionase family DNA binding protein
MRTSKHTAGRNSGRLTQPAGGDSTGPGVFSENQPGVVTASIELLTAAELANALKISLSTVRRLREQRRIPFIKIGGRIRFSRADVANYLGDARVKALGK